MTWAVLRKKHRDGGSVPQECMSPGCQFPCVLGRKPVLRVLIQVSGKGHSDVLTKP